MARLRFRLATIHLDEDEHVAAVETVVRDDTHRVVTELVGQVLVLESRRGDTELVVHLTRRQVLDLFDACGRFTDLTPGHEHTSEVYGSLSMVVHGLMDDE